MKDEILDIIEVCILEAENISASQGEFCRATAAVIRRMTGVIVSPDIIASMVDKKGLQ